MARRILGMRKIFVIVYALVNLLNIFCGIYVTALMHYRKYKLKRLRHVTRSYIWGYDLEHLMLTNDLECFENLRVNKCTFFTLCDMLCTIGRQKNLRYVVVEEMVLTFLHILAHDVKNRVVKCRFNMSGETISRHFNAFLNEMKLLQAVLLKKLDPISEDSTYERWKWFKNCLGALDGTYIKIKVVERDKPRYRTRKNDIATNVLGVCSQDMQFINVLLGWEGSAADSRVLRNVVSRRNGLIVPHGYYYLVDAGYTNGEGFLAPYRGQCYHLNDWREGHTPTTPEEFFNMKHSAIRNVIERCFGPMKLRWAILRGNSFYPTKTHCKIIVACCLPHNLIRREMPVDPLEIEAQLSTPQVQLDGEAITDIETTNQWSAWRTSLAYQMFNDWMASRANT